MAYDGSLLLFGDDFAAPPPAPAAAILEAPPPSYGEAEMEAARVAARAEGYAQGAADAAASDAARLAATIAVIGERLADAAASAAQVTEESVQAIAGLLLAAVLAGYPELGKRHGEEELRGLLREILPGMLREPEVRVRVHPSMTAAVTGELAKVPEEDRQHITVEPNDSVPPGDAKIKWPHGGAFRDAAGIAPKIADILRPLGLLPDAAAEAAGAEAEPEAEAEAEAR